ncbi:flagellar filament capping protein FliD [Pelagicoccus sp. SDUM812003]|uniref:flagellar filament capping protein FliD n=1 Tax=Pelagicoccus sp. SDUM812003 TaxID=3041267 RepID=UPI0028103BEF|nr:flagellar filament capping protein FliD [Pelagicoccus sp. SDUM812003]MDQ8201536.1 flagellar filament capping protein FliD [Pelagicoccus sp. SDUM812003]
MDNFNVAGLASGFDWNSMVDQLMAVERIPQRRLRTEQGANTDKVDALNTLKGKIEKLQGKVGALNSSALFNAKSAALGDDSLNITAKAATSANKGNFKIDVSTLATATKRVGTADVGGAMGDENTLVSDLRLSTAISEGTFSVNGQEITVSSTDTLQDVFDAISTATSGVVSASYDAGTDKISLTSASGELELGGDDDTSNFLAAMRLEQLEVVDGGGGSSKVTSRRALGVVDLGDSISNSGLTGSLTGSDTFFINGVAIDFDADNESVSALMERVNASAANVTMTYDSANDQFRIVNNETGAYAMNVIDSGNGLLASMGLTGAADIGDDLTFSIDGGANQTSRSNVITDQDHGLTGVTITAAEIGTQTVTINSDSEGVRSKINDFISAFNDVQDYIQEKTKISVEKNDVTAAVLSGNREIYSLDSKLRRMAFDAVEELESEGLFRLEHFGIDFISGTSKLEIKDSDKLDDALANDLSTMEKFFVSAENSFTSRLDEFAEGYLENDGIMDTITSKYTERNKAIDTQIEEMERRLELQRSALEASFIAMEEAQSKLSNQSAALASLQLGT